ELLGVERAALVLPETEDGRLAFVVPWEGRAVVGTTDSPYEGPLESPGVEEAEVEYLLRHVRRFLDVEVQPDDVLAAYAGLRPLVSGSGRSADLSRRHAVVLHEPGFVSVIGGKLTTYRRMAQDAVDVIARHEAREPDGLRIGPSRTHRLALVGAEHQERWPALVRQALKAGLAAAAAGRLVQTYGAEAGRLLDLTRARPELGRPLAPGLPHLAAEVVFACETSMPVRLEDLMDRRLRIGLVAPAAAAAAATEAARLMGERLGWSGPHREEELQRYLGGLGRWREGIQPGCVEGTS
ncbi:MAG TPA: glycerol-3-phosphate dehydrogenase C-terminal domain-containing protein, partial [Limnochordales bacterium]